MISMLIRFANIYNHIHTHTHTDKDKTLSAYAPYMHMIREVIIASSG